jgi:hypothetical protein
MRPGFASFSEGDEVTFGSFRFLFNRGFRPLHRSNMFNYNKVYDAIVYHGVHDDIHRRLLQRAIGNSNLVLYIDIDIDPCTNNDLLLQL